jgi:hypothetical protein
VRFTGPDWPYDRSAANQQEMEQTRCRRSPSALVATRPADRREPGATRRGTQPVRTIHLTSTNLRVVAWPYGPTPRETDMVCTRLTPAIAMTFRARETRIVEGRTTT